MHTIVNGKPDPGYRGGFDPPDRVIKLPNIEIAFDSMRGGGWKHTHVTFNDPEGGSGSGMCLPQVLYKPWVIEQIIDYVLELENQLRVLQQAISYSEK